MMNRLNCPIYKYCQAKECEYSHPWSAEVCLTLAALVKKGYIKVVG
jgi:hypothetical protein